ncbi:Molecular chaperone IbpA, HSP20 family [Bacillus sp. 166amftsu]|nr:Molecular chaperone IbpA, HSP20 family [Bacillus sp. 166amftsu]
MVLLSLDLDIFSKPMNMNSFKVDVPKDSDQYIVQADLPGFQKENIQVDFEREVFVNQERIAAAFKDGVLTVSLPKLKLMYLASFFVCSI